MFLARILESVHDIFLAWLQRQDVAIMASLETCEGTCRMLAQVHHNFSETTDWSGWAILPLMKIPYGMRRGHAADILHREGILQPSDMVSTTKKCLVIPS